MLKRCAWCCGGEALPHSQPLPVPTAGASGGSPLPASAAAPLRLAEPLSGGSPGPPLEVAAAASTPPRLAEEPKNVFFRASTLVESDSLNPQGEPPTPPPAHYNADFSGSGSSSASEVTPPPAREPAPESSLAGHLLGQGLDDDLDHNQFLARVMQLQNQVDARLRRGPPAVVLSSTPVYGKGSPLWEKPTDPDSDTDPDMPELIAATCPGRSATPLSTPNFVTGYHDDFDDEDEDSPRVNFNQKQGGLGSCWGQDALKDALKALDTEEACKQSRASDNAGARNF